MPAVTYLSDWQVKEWSSVPADKECDDLLQELRQLTGENWLIGFFRRPVRNTGFFRRLREGTYRIEVYYQLYADCHGEWQAMNLVTSKGGSNFNDDGCSREQVMNFMLGYISGIHSTKKVTKQ